VDPGYILRVNGDTLATVNFQNFPSGFSYPSSGINDLGRAAMYFGKGG
jgi:hypothetical protein